MMWACLLHTGNLQIARDNISFISLSRIGVERIGCMGSISLRHLGERTVVDWYFV